MTSTTTLVDAFGKASALDAPLKQRLMALAKWHRELNPAMAKAYDQLIERLTLASAGATAPSVDQPMPHFVLPSHEGRLETLDKILQSGPAVISFNRGHWCTYCKLEMFSLAQKQEELEQLGARTISIVPDRQVFARKFKEVSGVPFTVLTDVDNGYAMSLDLVVWLGEEIRSLYDRQEIDLVQYQGNHNWFVPIPATFVVGQDGLIKAQFVDPDFRKRMEIDKIFEALRALIG